MSNQIDSYGNRGSDSGKFASTVSGLLIVAGLVGGLIVASARWTRHEPVRSVRLVGCHALDSAEVIRMAALADTALLEKVDLDEVERRVSAHPFIAAVSAYRGEQGTLVIEVSERAPAAVTFRNGSPVYFDTAATPMPYSGVVSSYDVPVLFGVIRGTVVDTGRVRQGIRVATALRAYSNGLYRQISEIHRGEDGQFTLVCSDGALPVMIGDTTAIEGRIPKLDAFLRNVYARGQAGGTGWVDVRWAGQVVVRGL